MNFERDPRDRYYRERLTASFLVSLVLHVVLATLLFAMIFTQSQEAANESVQGGEVITVERRSPVVVAQQPAAVQAVPPVTHVPRIAPVHHAPMAQPQTQRLPQNRHELARQSPTAPPNPRPIPQRSAQPNPQPTQNVFELKPQTELPAAPVSVPTVAPVAIAIKAPPTAAPSPAPTAAPSARPSPKPPSPTTAPTTKPASPAPAAPSAAPTSAAVSVRSSAAPNASPAPAAHPSSVPATHPGVPSPSPTSVAAVAKTNGAAPTPGPKGTGSPGPHPGPAASSKPAPARPVQIPPTPSPAPAPKPAPSASGGIDLNARLRGLLPNNPINPSTGHYTPSISLHGSLEPTPPPDVLAKTKYVYRTRGGGSEARVVMWVTSIKKDGPTTMCTGWLVRYPINGDAPHAGDRNVVWTGAAIGGSARGGTLAPIVDGVVTQPCEGRLLEPYAAQPAPSP